MAIWLLLVLIAHALSNPINDRKNKIRRKQAAQSAAGFI